MKELSVSIARDPEIEAMALRQASAERTRSPNSPKRRRLSWRGPQIKGTEPVSMNWSSGNRESVFCFICDSDDIVSMKQAQRHYKKQVELFKSKMMNPKFATTLSQTLVTEFSKTDHTCSVCLGWVKEIWDFQQQIESIQQDIEEVMKSARNKLQLRAIKRETEFPEFPEISPDFEGGACFPLFGPSDIEDCITFRTGEGNLQQNNSPENEEAPKRPERKSKRKATEFLHTISNEKEDIALYHSGSDFKQTFSENGDGENGYPKEMTSSDEDEAQDATIKRSSSKGSSTTDKVTCDVCGKILKDLKNFKLHTNRVHLRVNKYKCLTCDKLFFRPYELKAHEMTHSKDGHFSCSRCGKILSTKKTLAIHEVTVCKVDPDSAGATALNIKFRQCPSCPQKFAKPADLKKHSVTHEGLRPHTCSRCGGQFTQKESLKMHELYSCKLNDSINQEEKAKFLERQRTFNKERKKYALHKCPNCPKKFKSAFNFTLHSHTCKPDQAKNVAICNICGKTIAKHDLTTHIRRVHEQVKRHFCPLCNRGYYSSGDCRKHVESHSKSQPKLPTIFECDICHERFKYASSVQKHKKRKHFIERNFECDVCKWKFFLKRDMLKHRNTHKRANLECEKCGRSFKSAALFARHEARVPPCDQVSRRKNRPTRLKIKICHVCQMSFHFQRQLNSHIQIEHPNEFLNFLQQKVESQYDEDGNSYSEEEEEENSEHHLEYSSNVPDLEQEVEIAS